MLHILSVLKNERPTWCHLLFYFISYVLSMFRLLIYPSSGANDCVVELHIGRLVQASACKTNTTQNQLHQFCNTQRKQNKTTDVVIQQHSRLLLMMDILISERCWAHKKWNKIASDIKLVFHSSTITMMHGPINIRFWVCVCILRCPACKALAPCYVIICGLAISIMFFNTILQASQFSERNCWT